MKQITSLYLHFPFCKHLCNYCDFYKHRLSDPQQIIDFEQLLLMQFEHHKTYLNDKGFILSDLETLYLGGGTPSLWTAQGAKTLKEKFQQLGVSLKSNVECTLEVDPNAWNDSDIMTWERFGVNRFSVGVQSYDEKLLNLMDRGHDLAAVEKLLKYLAEKNVNFSVDLMLGLPDSQNRNLKNEIDSLLSFSPKHLSVYILKTRSNYPHNKQLPDDDQIRKEYLFVSDYLESQGFGHYEVSNFAIPGYESKHNIKYWSYESVAGIGPNATGLLVDEKFSTRYQWKSQTVGVSEELIKGESLIIEKLFLGIRRNRPFDITQVFSSFDNLKIIEQLIQKWIDLGFVSPSSAPNSIYVTKLGFLMSDSILDDIFQKIDF